MVHRGEIVEQAVRQSGIAISEVAKRINRSRRHLYNIFENPNVPLETILQISKVIRKDITIALPEIQDLHKISSVSDVEPMYNKEESVNYWKDKYLNLLEKYNQLLEQKQ
jgi:plasmid maintenance system antidote protein VapI